MGARGPVPQPTRLKVLRGNPGKRPLNHNEPKPAAIAPKCPTWLDRDAKAEWRRVVPILDSLGLLTQVDMAVVAAYCQSYSRWKAAELLIQKAGLLIKTGGDRYQTVKHNPAVQIARDERQAMVNFGARLGLSPSDRGRLNVEPDSGSSKLDAFLRKKQG